MATIIILFFISSGTGFSQCKESSNQTGTAAIRGISNGLGHYYQNLVIQDLAIAGQKQFQEISLLLDYEVTFTTDRCRPGQLDISVKPVKLVCRPVFYQGYDISASLEPESADLVFHIMQENGVVSDSITFSGIQAGEDDGLYTLQSVRIMEGLAVTAAFARAEFHYSKKSYENFRNQLLEIDDYYAACMLADSAVQWAKQGFLEETGNGPLMSLRQLELEHILKFIRPGNFDSVFISGQTDLQGLVAKYKSVSALNQRYKAILRYNHLQVPGQGYAYLKEELLNSYLDNFDFYYNLSFRSDFRFVNFLNGIAKPEFSISELLALYHEVLKYSEEQANSRRFLSGILAKGLIGRGKKYESSGNQLRALIYYRSAMHVSELMNLASCKEISKNAADSMVQAIAASYLEISKRGALKENPAIAAQYFRDARDLFTVSDAGTIVPSWLIDHEMWLFTNFEEQVTRNIASKNYKKALDYLTEIENHCSTSKNYHCPGSFHDWMKTIREGLYLQLLSRANALLASDELPESEQVYRQALDLRQNGGYYISKDLSEAKLEVVFKQMYYDEYFDEGLNKYNKSEFVPALYYFNKAEFLENSGLVRLNPRLQDYRQASARQVMLNLLSDGRLKVWAHDYESAAKILAQVKGMLENYEFAKGDTLNELYLDLKDNILQSECRSVFDNYQELMKKTGLAEKEGNYIQAHKLASEAVELSMDNLKCRISDEEAWYQKIRLETLAEYQEMDEDLDHVEGKSIDEYISGFQDLKSYYNRNKLLTQGVVFTPLFDRVIMQEDQRFLAGMLAHYLYLDDYDHAILLMRRMHEDGFDPALIYNVEEDLGRELAKRDVIKYPDEAPWELLDNYSEKDKFYKAFRRSYQQAWLKASDWNIKYWPFIWKK